jgi:hypothetical protein
LGAVPIAATAEAIKRQAKQQAAEAVKANERQAVP